MANRPGVMIYFETAKAIRWMDYEFKGRLFDAMIAYAEDGEVPKFEGVLAAVWPFLASSIDRDAARYEEIVEQKRKAGRASAAKRQAQAEEQQHVLADADVCKQMLADADTCQQNQPTPTTTSTPNSTSTTTPTPIYKEEKDTRRDNGFFPEEKIRTLALDELPDMFSHGQRDSMERIYKQLIEHGHSHETALHMLMKCERE